MLKLLFMMVMLIPLSLMKQMYWLVQLYLFMISFIFMFMLVNSSMFMYISYFMSMDLISYGLMLLSLWICLLMMMASESINRFNYSKNFFVLNLLMLLLMLYLTFSSMNVFYFYLFFEGSLIPTLFLIIGWGYQPERLIYTLLASLPMLVGIFYL